MAYAKQNSAPRKEENPKQDSSFLKEKLNFFAKLPIEGTLDTKIKFVEEQKSDISHSFLLDNKENFETQFKQIFAILQNQDKKNKEAFWLYCYYCASLLQAFHEAYDQEKKAKEYIDKKEEIKKRLNNKKQKPTQSDESFIQHMVDSIFESKRSLLSAPFHLSQIRDYVSFSNLCRVYWTFCRLSMTTGLTLAKDLQIFDKLDNVLGTHTDVNKIISVLQAPSGVLNYFSVGLFLMRFIIEGGLLLKHTFFPSKEEEAKGTTRYARFQYELNKRRFTFANDLVWTTVNFITNFSSITHISGPIGGAITAVFLGFDLWIIWLQSHSAKEEYLVQRNQNRKERDKYENHHEYPKLMEQQRKFLEEKYSNLELYPDMTEQLKKLQIDLDIEQQSKSHIKMLDSQLDELEIDYRTKEAKFYFSAAAAALLMLGFSAALLFTPPGMVFASFFICTFAVAMYLSTGAYTKYKEKSLRLEDAQGLQQNSAVARKEYESARNDFIFTMAKNTIMPTLLITTYAVCWPAAIALTVLYIGYEIFHAYHQHKDSKEVKQLATPASTDEENADCQAVVLLSL